MNDRVGSLTTPLCKLLGVRAPVIQAPVGSATTPRLAAAVSSAGVLDAGIRVGFHVLRVIRRSCMTSSRTRSESTAPRPVAGRGRRSGHNRRDVVVARGWKRSRHRLGRARQRRCRRYPPFSTSDPVPLSPQAARRQVAAWRLPLVSVLKQSGWAPDPHRGEAGTTSCRSRLLATDRGAAAIDTDCFDGGWPMRAGMRNYVGDWRSPGRHRLLIGRAGR